MIGCWYDCKPFYIESSSTQIVTNEYWVSTNGRITKELTLISLKDLVVLPWPIFKGVVGMD